jgi:hypothetical protein
MTFIKKYLKSVICIPLSTLAVFLLAGAHAASVSETTPVSNIDGLYFFYQRTVYLENLCQPGAWWANPALLSPIDKITVFTSNTGLIGRQYIISAARIVLPVKPNLNIGFGATGTGSNEGRSLSAGNEGTRYSSNFSFNLPSLEGGISYVPPVGGNAGALIITGTEPVPDSSNPGLNTVYFFWGIGVGWISPAVMNTVRFSLSTLSVCHVQFETWWDNCAKAGLQINANNGKVLGSLEYGFSLFNGPVTFFRNPSNFHGYEVLKAGVSIKMMDIAGVLLGYSNDTPPNYFDNGATYHAGVELRRSEIYPYYGGYEMGISTSRHVSIIHRIWIGYGFVKKNKNS